MVTSKKTKHNFCLSLSLILLADSTISTTRVCYASLLLWSWRGSSLKDTSEWQALWYIQALLFCFMGSQSCTHTRTERLNWCLFCIPWLPITHILSSCSAAPMMIRPTQLLCTWARTACFANWSYSGLSPSTLSTSVYSLSLRGGSASP